MARGKKQVSGQLSLVLNMTTDRNSYVCQANDLIGGRQALKLNSAKLIRTAIMQIKPKDEVMNPYLITVPQLSDLLGVSRNDLYRDMDDITNDIISNPVFIRSEDGSRWVKYPWISYCEYQKDVGIIIQLNEHLKPFLLALKEHYSQYVLENVLAMKSVYAVRIYEMIQAKLMAKVIPKNGMDVELTVEEIRDGCDLGEKYKSFSNMRSRVIDVAEKEINRVTLFDISHTYRKTDRNVTAIIFHVNMAYH